MMTSSTTVGCSLSNLVPLLAPVSLSEISGCRRDEFGPPATLPGARSLRMRLDAEHRQQRFDEHRRVEHREHVAEPGEVADGEQVGQSAGARADVEDVPERVGA